MAADQGHAIAQCNLAIMHHKGEGGTVDLDEARALYAKSAAQGDPEALERTTRPPPDSIRNLTLMM